MPSFLTGVCACVVGQCFYGHCPTFMLCPRFFIFDVNRYKPKASIIIISADKNSTSIVSDNREVVYITRRRVKNIVLCSAVLCIASLLTGCLLDENSQKSFSSSD